jgi:ribonuclease D
MKELYIDNDDALRTYLVSIEADTLLAVDTEFVREKTYYPQLCLLQIASRSTIACIDCLAPIDLEMLLERLLREDCTWIVHSSRQDLEVIHQHAARLPAQLIDTQLAASIVGFAPQIGLQDLLADTLGVRLDKEYTRTDWSVRPLPEAALAYARDDVRSLIALWETLAQRLDVLGRRAWVEQDCALVLRQDPVAPPEQIWSRLKGLRGLDDAGRATALALIIWREEHARSRNRPRRWVLADEQLVALAKARPQSQTELRELEGLPPRLVQRAGAEILEALAAGASDSMRERALAAAESPDKQRLRDMQARVKTLATKLGIPPEVLATKQEIVELLAGRTSHRVSATWRGALLRDLTAGAGQESGR